MKRAVPKEYEEQVALFAWAEVMVKRGIWEFGLLYAIPNAGGYSGGYRANVRRVIGMLRQGVRKGFPDVGLPVARHGFHGLFIELKRLEKGRISRDQQRWHEQLAAQHYAIVLANGWHSAARALCGYLDLPDSLIA